MVLLQWHIVYKVCKDELHRPPIVALRHVCDVIAKMVVWRSDYHSYIPLRVLFPLLFKKFCTYSEILDIHYVDVTKASSPAAIGEFQEMFSTRKRYGQTMHFQLC